MACRLVGLLNEGRPYKGSSMIRTVRLLHLAIACFSAAIVAFAPAYPASAERIPAKPVASAAPAASCTSATYAYAGLFSDRAGTGIEATVTMLAHAVVTQGHVAGWIGVGGLNAGPKGKTEWLQAGLATTEDGKTAIYAETVQVGLIPSYQALVPDVVPGRPYHLAVRTLPNRPEVWQVWLNGRPVTPAVKLPGSTHFEPMAMSESWNGGPPPTCNGFSYRFAQLKIASRNGVWSALTHTTPLANKGYKITHRTADGFTARSG
jgi:hypothetical protein